MEEVDSKALPRRWSAQEKAEAVVRLLQGEAADGDPLDAQVVPCADGLPPSGDTTGASGQRNPSWKGEEGKRTYPPRRRLRSTTSGPSAARGKDRPEQEFPAGRTCS